MLDHHALISVSELAEKALKALGSSAEKVEVNRLTDIVVRRGSAGLASIIRKAAVRRGLSAAFTLSPDEETASFASEAQFGTVIDWRLTEYMRHAHGLDNATPRLLRRRSFVDVVSTRLDEARVISRRSTRYRVDELASLISLAHGIFVALRFSGSVPPETRSYWLRRATSIMNGMDYDELRIGAVDGATPFSRGINLRDEYQAAVFEHSLAVEAVRGFQSAGISGCYLHKVLPPNIGIPPDVALWADIVLSRRSVARGEEADTVRSQLEAEKRIQHTDTGALSDRSSREEFYRLSDPTQTAKSRFHTTVGDKTAVDALSALSRALRQNRRVGSKTLAAAKDCLSRSHRSYMSSDGIWWHCYAHHLMVRALYASVISRQSSSPKHYQGMALYYLSTAEAAFYRTNDHRASQRASDIKFAIIDRGTDWLEPDTFQKTFFGLVMNAKLDE